jgi:hypothetical protein
MNDIGVSFKKTDTNNAMMSRRRPEQKNDEPRTLRSLLASADEVIE